MANKKKSRSLRTIALVSTVVVALMLFVASQWSQTDTATAAVTRNTSIENYGPIRGAMHKAAKKICRRTHDTDALTIRNCFVPAFEVPDDDK